MDRKLNIVIPLLLFLFITAILPGLPGMEYDIRTGWIAWSLYIHQNGLINAYGSGTQYMPVLQYFLWLYGMVMGTDKAIIEHIPYLRCITLAFDFTGIWYVYKWINKKLAFYALLSVCILNISYSYNTLIWGQVDGIFSAMLFIAIYYAWKGANLWSMVWIVLAFNFKLQTIVILPLWGLLFINNCLPGKLWHTVFLPLLVAILLQIALLIPFSLAPGGIGKICYAFVHSFSIFPAISIKAPNLWHWVAPGNLLYEPDNQVWIAGLTYKQAGLVLFFTTSFFALLPLMLIILKKMKRGVDSIHISRELVWTTAALLYLLFYFFNTEIHERYCHPAFIFITAFAFFTNSFFEYVLFSIMYFLTLEFSMQQLHLSNYGTLIFDMRFLSIFNAIIILSLSVKIYRYYNLSISKSSVQ